MPKPISDTRIVSPTRGPTSDSVRYYESETGRAFHINLRTLHTDTLSDQRLPGFLQTFWSPSGRDVVSSFEQKGAIQLRSFNYDTQKSAPIGTMAIVATFSPTGRALAYIESADDVFSIYIANTDGTEPRKIFSTRSQAVSLEWPTENTLALLTKREDTAGRDLALIDTSGAFKILLKNQENLEYFWSRDGKRILFSFFAPNQDIQLAYMDLPSETIYPLSTRTSASKCAFTPDINTVVCGVPTTPLPRDIEAEKTATLDDIVSIDIISDTLTKISTATKSTLISVSDPLISSSGNYITFTNLFDRRLYKLDL